MVKARRWAMVKSFQGTPKQSDLRLVEEELPPLKDGEALFEAVYLTVDPYMRLYMRNMPEGSTMNGEQVAKVIESKNPNVKVGQYYLGYWGWRSHTISSANPGNYSWADQTIEEIPPIGDDLPKSLSLGILGMPGATAYLGLLKIGQLKDGETVFVNGAAGAVGSIVGQIAKIKGCTVIGSAGTEDKIQWLKSLGFDHVFNYKTVGDLGKTLKEMAPDNIDVYYDNVGGDMTDLVITSHMKMYGRVVVIGHISRYNDTEVSRVINPYLSILSNRLTVQGYIVGQSPRSEWIAAFKEMEQWIREGKLQYKEHLTEGFDNMPQAFFGLFTGDNVGKAIVKV